jgi:hypothetical protein
MDSKALIGKTFGRWTVTAEAPPSSDRHLRVECCCQCGKVGIVAASRLRRGRSKSCGCLTAELFGIRVSKRLRIHGLSATPEYNVWAAMCRRCTDPGCSSYKNYGGRGIGVFEGWRQSFETFLAHIGNRPKPELTLERVDNNRGYEPGNVIWATRHAQRRNQRSRVHLVTIDGVTKCLKDWALTNGIPYPTVQRRVYYLKWDDITAVTNPVRVRAAKEFIVC